MASDRKKHKTLCGEAAQNDDSVVDEECEEEKKRTTSDPKDNEGVDRRSPSLSVVRFSAKAAKSSDAVRTGAP